jgi:hypothetical protein
MVVDYVVGYLLVMVTVEDVQQVDMLTDVIDVVVVIPHTVPIVLLVELLVMVRGALVNVFNVLQVNMVVAEPVILVQKENTILTRVEPVPVNVIHAKQVDTILILLAHLVMLVLQVLPVYPTDLGVTIVQRVVMLLQEVLVLHVVLVLIILTVVKVHVLNVHVVNSKTPTHKRHVKHVGKVNIPLLQVILVVLIVALVAQVIPIITLV